jgi:hypothetical protein
MPKVGFDCFDKLVMEKAKDKMVNIVGSKEPIARCD